MRISRSVLGGLTAAAIGLGASQASAIGVVDVNQGGGNPFDILGSVDTSTTNGADMAGMSITALFFGGHSETRTWAATGGNSGGVMGTGWSLSQTGNTFDSNWALNVFGAQLVGLIIDAIPGGTVFDVGGSPSTPGTGAGFSLSSVTGPDALNIMATYLDPVSLNGVLSGDLFGRLFLEFNFLGNVTIPPQDINGPQQVNLVQQLQTVVLPVQFPFSNGNLTFQSDTDSASASSRIVPTVSEPAMLGIYALGLIGLGMVARRKLKKA